MSVIEEEIARALRSADRPDVPEHLPMLRKYEDMAAVLSPLLNRVRAEAQVEALDRAAGAIADLRPGGFAVIANVNARRRDGALWEAQSTVERMVRDIEQNSEGNET